MRQVIIEHLGTVDYKETWEYQESLREKMHAAKKAFEKENAPPPHSHLLFCEHPHVYTLGKSGDERHLLLSNPQLSNIDAKFYKINRGGDITYHGPGQLVMYPIFDLEQFFKDIHKYLRLMEEAVIRTLAEYNINGERSEGETGVWLDVGTPEARKICAFGVHVSRWITLHGLALNVNAHTEYFNHIIPCGIPDKGVTSMHIENRGELVIQMVKERLIYHMQDLFGFEILEEIQS